MKRKQKFKRISTPKLYRYPKSSNQHDTCKHALISVIHPSFVMKFPFCCAICFTSDALQSCQDKVSEDKELDTSSSCKNPINNRIYVNRHQTPIERSWKKLGEIHFTKFNKKVTLQEGFPYISFWSQSYSQRCCGVYLVLTLPITSSTSYTPEN